MVEKWQKGFATGVAVVAERLPGRDVPTGMPVTDGRSAGIDRGLLREDVFRERHDEVIKAEVPHGVDGRMASWLCGVVPAEEARRSKVSMRVAR